jgi:cell division septal protein FtsQ
LNRIIKIFILILSVVFLIYITNANFFRIQKIVVNEVEYSDRNEIELSIKESMEGRYFGLFAKSNIFILPRKKIYREVQNKFPSVKNINLDLKGLTEISVELEEYKAGSLWCDIPVTPASGLVHEDGTRDSDIPQVVSDVSKASCYFMNEEGIIFAKTSYDSNPDIIKTFGKIISDPVRQSYTDKKTFENLVEFTKLLRRINLSSDEIWTTNGAVYAFVTKENVKIYVEADSDPAKNFENLETVIKRDAINQAQMSNIDYIDLRFGNRIFYKLK